MKKLFVIGLCGAVLCACVKDEMQRSSGQPLVTREIRVEAATPPAARTELAEDGYHVLWSPGDRIGVYVKSGDTFTTVNAPLTFEGTEASANGVFKGDISFTEGVSDYTIYAYYPYSAQSSTDASGVTFTLDASQMQTASGDSSHLGTYDFLVAGAVTNSVAEFSGLLFKHAFAVVETDLTASGIMAGKSVESVTLYCTDAATVQGDGSLIGETNMAGDFTFDLTAAQSNYTATYAGGSAQIGYCSMSFETSPTLGSEPVKAYLTINPADYSTASGEVYVVVRTTDGYTATYTKPGIVIGAGQMKVITQQVTTGVAPQPTVELTSGESANCYVANLPAQEYSFDATVGGNGVITTGLQQAIQRYEGRTLSSSLSGAFARVLWQSNPYLIEPGSVAYNGGKISFSLTTRPTSMGGNVVIGLFASDDPAAEALWSWHIWITDKSNEELLAMAETYVLYSDYEAVYGAGTAQMMDRNLGAVYKEDGPYARSFRAPLYQWGRKDAFPWGKVVYDEQSVPHTYITEWQPVQTTGSLGQYVGYTGNTYYATAHPDIFIATVAGSSYDWYYGGGQGNTAAFRNNELWGNPEGYTVGRTTTKTLFDPCPPGWKMPHAYVFSAFTSTGQNVTIASGDAHVSGSFVQGWNFIYNGSDTSYWPGVGYRYDEYGIFQFQPSGYYWCSSPSQPGSFGAWAFGMTGVNIYTYIPDPRGFGLPVRCMKE